MLSFQKPNSEKNPKKFEGKEVVKLECTAFIFSDTTFLHQGAAVLSYFELKVDFHFLVIN